MKLPALFNFSKKSKKSCISLKGVEYKCVVLKNDKEKPTNIVRLRDVDLDVSCLLKNDQFTDIRNHYYVSDVILFASMYQADKKDEILVLQQQDAKFYRIKKDLIEDAYNQIKAKEQPGNNTTNYQTKRQDSANISLTGTQQTAFLQAGKEQAYKEFETKLLGVAKKCAETTNQIQMKSIQLNSKPGLDLMLKVLQEGVDCLNSLKAENDRLNKQINQQELTNGGIETSKKLKDENQKLIEEKTNLEKERDRLIKELDSLKKELEKAKSVPVTGENAPEKEKETKNKIITVKKDIDGNAAGKKQEVSPVKNGDISESNEDSETVVTDVQQEKVEMTEAEKQALKTLQDTIDCIRSIIDDLNKGGYMINCVDKKPYNEGLAFDAKSLLSKIEKIPTSNPFGIDSEIKKILFEELGYADSVLNKIATNWAYSNVDFATESRDEGQYFIKERMDSIYNKQKDLLSKFGFEQQIPSLFKDELDSDNNQYVNSTGEKVSSFAAIYGSGFETYKDPDRPNLIIDIAELGFKDENGNGEKTKIILFT